MVTARKWAPWWAPWCLAWALCVLASAVSAQYAAPCSLVFGHGRNAAQGDVDSAAFWDGINRALAQQVVADIAARGHRAVLLFLPVTQTDQPAILATVLERASGERCDRVIETTLFANADDVIVARLRAYPLFRDANGLRVGSPFYSDQQEYPNTQRNRERLVPAQLGQALAEQYLRSQAPKP